jgi:Tfp pilus assembly PilM family ATPase
MKRSAFPIKSRGPIIALDWDGPLVCAAQSVERGGKAEIARFAAARVQGSSGLGQPEPDLQAAGACLAQALRDLDLKPGAVVMGIPRGLVFLRTLSLPKPATPAELAAMVHFQISKDLPFPPEQAVIDFQSSDRPPSAAPAAPPASPAQDPAAEPSPAAEKVDVVVAVVKKEIVRQCQRIAEAAGVKLVALGLNPWANARGLQACEPAAATRTVALVTLRQEEIIIDVIARGSLVFSRSAPLAPGDGPEAKAQAKPENSGGAETALVAAVTIETVRSLHNYEGLERHEPIEEILVVGAQGGEAAIVKALGVSCQLPCRRVDPAGALGPGVEHSEHSRGALTVLGLALSAQDQTPWPFDFLQPKRPPAPRNRRRAILLQAAAAAVILLCVLWGLRAVLIHRQLKTKNQLQALLDRTANNRQAFREVRLKAKTLRDWMTDKREWLDHYAYLNALLPPSSDVYVTSISAGARGVLHVSIQARSGEILGQIDKRLREAGYELKPLAVTPCSDRYGYSFQSSLEITLPAKMKIDLAALKAPERQADDGSLDPPHSRSGDSKRGRNRP